MTTINNDNILTMFEEINLKLDKTNQQIEKIGREEPETTGNEDIAELKSAIENLCDNQSEKLENIETLIQKEKRKIEFIPTTWQGMAVFFSLMLIILTMAIWINSLRSQNSTLSDNDLKYRYVKMIGGASQEDLASIDTIFYFNQDSKKVNELRKKVEVFEENIKQRARIIEQEEKLKRKKETLDSLNQAL